MRRSRMDSVTNGVVITDATKFVQQKKKELSGVNNNSNDGQSAVGVRNSANQTF
ncbi:MAG: hypothetical protein WA393_09185 [Nitrososphaeraceae archaeon]